jgi:putative sigma-54 modulation protein
MRIEIHARQFALTDALRDHIERRLQFAMSWSRQHLQKVSFHLGDINGPKGGADKSCRIQIPLVGGKQVVVEEVQTDLYVAIDRAIERAGRVLARHLERRRAHGHGRLPAVDASEDVAVLRG